ncbi:hypothetical protein BDQ17DRAFT_1388421 [Cyathus striatus]|nr:hypothetical protein BDQ17DRAFT_1388421 [Cyathus striatus]
MCGTSRCGHAGVLTSEDGSILIKPALPLELQFYQSLNSDSGFSPLRPYIPKFLGTLKLEGEMGGDGASVVPLPEGEVEGTEKESLVLENLSHGFEKPNILDVKLGTVLYDESASEDKVERMKKTARNTTSEETGVRLTGFQVHGIRKFFPLPSSSSPLGLPAKLLLPMLESIKDDITEIRDALSQVHMRMVGGSLLIIYEADWAKAEEGVAYWLEGQGDESISSDDDEESDDDDDEGEGKEGEGKKKPKPPYIIKLIDFAHTRFKPGEGPDEGVLKGVDTVLGLLEGRIEEVKDAMDENV